MHTNNLHTTDYFKGCHGGHESIAYRYVEKYGIQSESTYEYEGQVR